MGAADCYVCHEAEFAATTEPPHPDLFPTSCADCHTNEAWVPAIALQHDWFVLQNRHLEIHCSECHTAGYRMGDTPNECVGCHQADYDGADMPPHQGYPTACATCHTDAGWVPSIFNHPWTLDGAHLLVECASCHTGDPPTWAGVPTTCVGCHQADYDGSPYEGHSTFPTTCIDCHSTTAWMPALEGGHPNDRFPLRDPHDYECTQCHDPTLGSSAMGANTDCVGCHEGEHTRARMDEKHREEADYPVGTSSVSFCLDCHPDGRN